VLEGPLAYLCLLGDGKGETTLVARVEGDALVGSLGKCVLGIIGLSDGPLP
jgi:hypothetical protein